MPSSKGLFSDDCLFGGLAEDDLFTLPGSLFPSSIVKSNFLVTAEAAPSPSSLHSSPPEATKADFSEFDLDKCLVSQIIDQADPSVVSLFDLEHSQLFSSLFAVPPSAPTGAPMKAKVAKLHPAQAAHLLASTEAFMAANPSMPAAPAVARLRQSLIASQLASPCIASPASQFAPTPFLGPFELEYGSPAMSIGSSLALQMPDAMSIQWDSPNDASVVTVDPPIKPKAKVGRKRKERPNDPIQLLEEIDLKRQRNTESARRSRIKRMAELDALHKNLALSQENEKKAQERIKLLEAELEKAKKLLALAGKKLKESL
ncbi:hypothetical protein HDU83_002241 [Entophlyctis luteolus]|nr:hypothetical protein HDU83_002241 [Entophlyctis luteolus]